MTGVNLMEMQRWKGKCAFITGASSGIGQATVKALAQHGMHVAFCARSVEKIQALQDFLTENGSLALGMELDLCDENALQAAFTRIQAQLGPVAVLINNAAVGYYMPLIGGDPALWRKTLEVNVISLSLCTSIAIKQMLNSSGCGHIINISSLAAHRHKAGAVGNAMYVASKHAVRSLTESLRIELREMGAPIRISSISPGLVETGFAANFYGSKERAEVIYGSIDTLQPEDIAEIVSFLLSLPAHVEVNDVLVRPTQQKE
jgi:NADP-dependent 3-hydroxy acid dehydrogenase YdfG